MKDYGQIISKIGSTPWLITQDGLTMMMSIIDSHLKGNQLSEDDLENIRLEASSRGNGNGKKSTTGSIGVLPLHGPIFGKSNLMTEMSGATSLEMFKDDFRAMMDSQDISSIILDIDSPGGTSDLVQEIGSEILAARDEKPIYAIANTQAGSAAYWLGSQASKMYVTPSGLVGSVGAYTVHTDQSDKDAKDGIKYTFTSAGPYKTEGNPHEPLTAEGIEHRQKTIDELYTSFVDAVATGRDVSTDQVRVHFGGGRMVTPKDALSANMVDGILSFDSLVGTIQDQPRQVQVVMDGKAIAAVMKNGAIHLESKEWEHSQPGTGSPPAPRKDQDGSDDKAIKGGWRREIPDENDRSILPTQSPPNTNLNSDEGGEMETVQEQLYRLLGVTDDESLLASVTAMHTEQAALQDAVHLSSEEARFSKEFPNIWKQHNEDKVKARTRDAKEFADNVLMFTKPEGDAGKVVETGTGLSALARDGVETFHLAFAEGKATLADFEETIRTITNGGTVDYKEIGSERPKDISRAFDSSTPVGIAAARQQFAVVVSEVVDEFNGDDKYTGKNEQEIYALAVTEAAKREPDLAVAYRQASPGKP